MSFKKGDKVLCLSPGLWGPPYLAVGTIRPFGKQRGYLKYGPAIYEEIGPFPLSEFIPHTPEAETELMSLLGEVKAAYASYETLRKQMDDLWTSLRQEEGEVSQAPVSCVVCQTPYPLPEPEDLGKEADDTPTT